MILNPLFKHILLFRQIESKKKRSKPFYSFSVEILKSQESELLKQSRKSTDS